MRNMRFGRKENIQDLDEHLVITKDTATSIIKICQAGTKIKEVIVKINTAFTGTFAISLGFPADHSEIFATTNINLSKASSVYKFHPWRISEIYETLTLYVTGTSTAGDAEIFVEIDR